MFPPHLSARADPSLLDLALLLHARRAQSQQLTVKLTGEHLVRLVAQTRRLMLVLVLGRLNSVVVLAEGRGHLSEIVLYNKLTHKI